MAIEWDSRTHNIHPNVQPFSPSQLRRYHIDYVMTLQHIPEVRDYLERRVRKVVDPFFKVSN